MFARWRVACISDPSLELQKMLMGIAFASGTSEKIFALKGGRAEKLKVSCLVVIVKIMFKW